jgi:hypothetical protein
MTGGQRRAQRRHNAHATGLVTPGRRWLQRPAPKRMQGSFTEHFRHEENDDGSDKASSSQEINQGVSNGGKHRYCYKGSHKFDEVLGFLALDPLRSGCKAFLI